MVDPALCSECADKNALQTNARAMATYEAILNDEKMAAKAKTDAAKPVFETVADPVEAMVRAIAILCSDKSGAPRCGPDDRERLAEAIIRAMEQLSLLRPPADPYWGRRRSFVDALKYVDPSHIQSDEWDGTVPVGNLSYPLAAWFARKMQQCGARPNDPIEIHCDRHAGLSKRFLLARDKRFRFTKPNSFTSSRSCYMSTNAWVLPAAAVRRAEGHRIVNVAILDTGFVTSLDYKESPQKRSTDYYGTNAVVGLSFLTNGFRVMVTAIDGAES